MKKVLLSALVLTCLSNMAWATPHKESITCSNPSQKIGDALVTAEYKIGNELTVSTYATTYKFPITSLVTNKDEVTEATIDRMETLAEQETVILKNVKLNMIFLKSQFGKSYLLINKLSHGEDNITVAENLLLKCN